MFNKKFGIIALILFVILTIGCFIVNTGAISTVLLAIQGAITDGNLVEFSGINGIGVDTGLSATNVVKCKFDATFAPTINNDVDEGYTVGSRWLDVTDDKSYVCLDNTDGAAVWTETTQLGGSETFTGLSDTPADYTGQAGKYTKVNAGETALEFETPAGAGDMTKAVYDTDTDNIVDKAETVDDGVGNSSTAVDVKDAVTKKHTSGSETQGGDLSGTVGNASVDKIKRGLDASKSATPTVGDIYLATDTDKLYKCITAEAWTLLKNLDLSGNNVADLADVTSAGAAIEDAVTKKHIQNSDTTFNFANELGSDHTYSGELDTQTVGEAVAFGDLLYFDWVTKRWKLTDADSAPTMPGLRIALETKTNGETCLMLVKGYIRDDSAFEFTGAMVYASVTPGAVSSTAPTETGDQVQRVGVGGPSKDILFFDPSIDVGEI